MKKTINLITIIAVLFAFVGCSKERKIEKNLWKKGGDWEITQYISHYGSYNPAINGGVNPQSEIYNNCGSMHFGKDGSGTVSLTIDGSTETYSFTYSNTENTLTLIIDGSAQIYDLDWSKDVATFSYDKTANDPDGFPFADSESFVIAKK